MSLMCLSDEDKKKIGFEVYWAVYPVLKKYESHGFDAELAARKIVKSVQGECASWLLMHHPECREKDCLGNCGEDFGK